MEFLMKLILAFSALLSVCICLRSEDLCLYKSKCLKRSCEPCTGKYARECGKGVCGLSDKACIDYSMMTNLIKHYQSLQKEEKTLNLVKGTNALNRRLRKYEKILNNIHECEAERDVRELDNNSVCALRDDCQGNCECPVVLSIRCNEYFCAESEQNCANLNIFEMRKAKECI